MINFLVYALFLVSCIAFASQDAPEVEIDQGLLRGYYRKTWKGRTFSAFTGIPYAEPPVGELRFKAPVPAGSWTGTLDASKPHAVCPQMNIFLKDHAVQGSEDCLYLNIYTPQLPRSEKKLLPVMFFIHSGGYVYGHSNSKVYGPDILLDKDVVLVTSNYRLGALGFLSTGDSVAPGNNGLKDQNLALKWVKKSISHFGGDPEQVTIFGQSAGGASTHFHVVSPLSRDLIKGAIIESGTAVASWALASKTQTIKNVQKLATGLNCPVTSSHEIVQCLRKVEAHDIVAQDLKFLEWSYDPVIPFKPVIEPDLEGAFLTEDPIDIIKSGKSAKVPIITGIAKDDGALRSAGLYNDTDLIIELDKDFNRIAPITLFYDESSANKDDISKRVRELYFGNRKIDTTTKTEVTQMYTDAWFLLAADSLVRLHSKYTDQPLYYFLFGYRGTLSFGPIFGDPSHDYGTCHGDELFYLFSSPDYKPNDSDQKMTDIMAELWTNFAKTGNPTPETSPLINTKWEPVHSKKLEYYFIKGTSNTMDEDMYSERVRFWRNVPFGPRWTKFGELSSSSCSASATEFGNHQSILYS